MGKKTDRLGGRYGGEPEKAIADPGNNDVENPVIQSSVNGGSNKSIRRPKEEVKMPSLRGMVREMLKEYNPNAKMDDVKSYIYGSGANIESYGQHIQSLASDGKREMDVRSIESAVRSLKKDIGTLETFIKTYKQMIRNSVKGNKK